MPTTVILGAGIIGLSSAHALAHLAPPDHRIHLVEPAPKLFASASGKAAGFLAKDWFAPAIAPLGALSFDLHRTLADKHNGRARWGYAESLSYSLDHAYQSDDAPTPDAPSAGMEDSPSQVPMPDEGPESTESREGIDSAANIDEGHVQRPSGRNGSQGEGGLDWLMANTSRATAVDADATEGAQSTAIADADGVLPKWLRAKPEALEAISDRKSTAQVLPHRLCEFLLEQCLAAGVTLHHPARATQLLRDDRDPTGLTRIRVEYLGNQQQSESPEGRARVVDILCENVIIAAGCWTARVYTTLFPNASRIPRVTHLAGYSVTFKSKDWRPVPPTPQSNARRAPNPDSEETESSADPLFGTDPCHAIFTDTAGFAPEIFSRALGDIWLGGLNPPTTPLPALPTDAQIEPAEVERLLAVGRALCGDDIEVRTQALCFRPVSVTGRPIIARMHEADLGDGLKPAAGGVFVATGHGPWGITLSLGTGQVLAEMVLGRETSADIEALSRW